MWDDFYLSNADFGFIYPFFPTEEVNRLEMKFLELIQYNVTVKANLYAKYYFEMRALFKDNELEYPKEPIEKHDAIKLEVNSSTYLPFCEQENIEERLNSSFGGITSLPMAD